MKITTYLGNYLFQEIIMDLGVEINLINAHTIDLIITAMPSIILLTNKVFNITSIVGQARVIGYLVIDINLREGVKVALDSLEFGDLDKWRRDVLASLDDVVEKVQHQELGWKGNYFSVSSSDVEMVREILAEEEKDVTNIKNVFIGYNTESVKEEGLEAL
ncbi:hypothetical protein RUND412_010560 [Rhizina undulata]